MTKRPVDPIYRDEMGKFLKHETQQIIAGEEPTFPVHVARAMQAYMNDGPRAIGKSAKVPVRRGTGPKACMKKFLEAFDAWDGYVDSFDGDIDGMSYEELGKLATLEAEMHKARAEVKGVMGLG